MAFPAKNNEVAFSKDKYCMKPLIISALAAALVGCTWFAPQQAQQASLMGNSATDTPRTDSYTAAKAEKAINAKMGHRRHRKRTGDTKIAKANRVPKMDTSSRVQPENMSGTSIKAQSTVVAKTLTQEAAPSDHKASTSSNAQSTAATKMETQQAVQPESSTSINAQSTIATKTETQQAAQLNDKSDPVLKKAMSAIAAKMQNSASVELVAMKRAEKNAPGKSVDTICGDVRGKSASGLDTGERPFLYLVKEDQAYIGLYDIATSPYHNLCDK
jgi:hypothetical protein